MPSSHLIYIAITILIYFQLTSGSYKFTDDDNFGNCGICLFVFWMNLMVVMQMDALVVVVMMIIVMVLVMEVHKMYYV